MLSLTGFRSLISPIVIVRVGSKDPRTFNLHKSLVCKESAFLSKAFHGGFKEASKQECTLPEEDPRMFGYFVEYMYREGWLHDDGGGQSKNHRNTVYDLIYDYEERRLIESKLKILLTLTRLYIMGDRLMAKGFQELVLRKFITLMLIFHGKRQLPNKHLCDLLKIVYTEIPDTPREDPLQARVFWLAAAQLRNLQNSDRFPQLLREHPELAVKLCMVAGNADKPLQTLPQQVPTGSVEKRFKPEGSSSSSSSSSS